jgi:hypothetical protein
MPGHKIAQRKPLGYPARTAVAIGGAWEEQDHRRWPSNRRGIGRRVSTIRRRATFSGQARSAPAGPGRRVPGPPGPAATCAARPRVCQARLNEYTPGARLVRGEAHPGLANAPAAEPRSCRVLRMLTSVRSSPGSSRGSWRGLLPACARLTSARWPLGAAACILIRQSPCGPYRRVCANPQARMFRMLQMLQVIAIRPSNANRLSRGAAARRILCREKSRRADRIITARIRASLKPSGAFPSLRDGSFLRR